MNINQSKSKLICIHLFQVLTTTENFLLYVILLFCKKMFHILSIMMYFQAKYILLLVFLLTLNRIGCLFFLSSILSLVPC